MKGWHVIISHEDFVANKICCISIDIHVSASLRAAPMWKDQHMWKDHITWSVVLPGFFLHICSQDFQVSPSQI